MHRLFLVISVFWLLPAVCPAVNIPLQSALLVHGEPVGFERSAHRQKRSETENRTCRGDEYNPPDKNHCCNKCLAGYMVVSHCSGEGMKSNCTRCEEGFYKKSPGGLTTCNPCSECLSTFGQVELQPCTNKIDTVCGCPAGHYKSDGNKKFQCLPCRTCENGSAVKNCTFDHDTICICKHDFYLADGNCRPCIECTDNEACKHRCPQTSIKPEEPNFVSMILAGVMGVALLAVLIVFFVKNRHKIKEVLSTVQTKSPLPATDISGSSEMDTPLMKSSTSRFKLDSLPGHIVCVVEDPVLEQQNKAQNLTLPLPDVTLETTTPCLKRPEFLYKVIECIPVGRWREFIRRLGVSNHVIETAEHDNRPYKEAQYAMLSFWVHNAGSSAATRDTLFRVLREMNLGGCVERIEENL